MVDGGYKGAETITLMDQDGQRGGSVRGSVLILVQRHPLWVFSALP